MSSTSLKQLPLLMLLLLGGCEDKRHYVARHAVVRDLSDTSPYLSGNAFRCFADHIVDNTRVPFYPERVKEGDVVYLKTKYIKRFMRYMHPRIKARYILLTHAGDEDIPGEQMALLEDKKVLKWFGMNPTLSHPKLVAVPIGVDSERVQAILDLRAHPVEKERLLYLNFDEKTHPERVEVKAHFSKQPFCTIQERLELTEFLGELMRSKFTVSPRGNGIDCIRVWESLMLGTIPIVKSSSLDSLYADLPVLIVQDWSEVTEEFLERKWPEMAQASYRMEKLQMDYWFNQINEVRKGV